MNKTLRFILIVVTVVIGGVGLLFAGALIGQSALGLAGFWPSKNLPQFISNQLDTSRQNFGFMPESSLKGSNRQGYSKDAPAAYNYSMGAGMMGRSTTDYYDRENPEGALTDCSYG